MLIKAGKDDVAATYITKKAHDEATLKDLQRNHDQAKIVSDKAQRSLDLSTQQMQRRSTEIENLINQSKNAKLQEELAQTMISFSVGDDTGTLDEMRDKIQHRAAQADARLELAGTTPENQELQIEDELLHSQVQDSLAAYKQEMGLLGPASDSIEAAKMLGSASVPA